MTETLVVLGSGAQCSNPLDGSVGAQCANLPVWVPAGARWPTLANASSAKTGTIDICVQV